MCASPDVFAHLTHLLMNLAGGKLCAVLEVRPHMRYKLAAILSMEHLVVKYCVGFSREGTTWLPSTSLCVRRFKLCSETLRRDLQTSTVPVQGRSTVGLNDLRVCFTSVVNLSFCFQCTWVPSLCAICSQAVLVLPQTCRYNNVILFELFHLFLLKKKASCWYHCLSGFDSWTVQRGKKKSNLIQQS